MNKLSKNDAASNAARKPAPRNTSANAKRLTTLAATTSGMQHRFGGGNHLTQQPPTLPSREKGGLQLRKPVERQEFVIPAMSSGHPDDPEIRELLDNLLILDTEHRYRTAMIADLDKQINRSEEERQYLRSKIQKGKEINARLRADNNRHAGQGANDEEYKETPQPEGRDYTSMKIAWQMQLEQMQEMREQYLMGLMQLSDGHGHHHDDEMATNRSIDMNNINPDRMTYEQLLQLEEKMGKVSRGLKPEEIARLKTISFPGKKDSKESKDSGDNLCTVCFSEFERGEKLILLSCKHNFHKSCIEDWLQQEKKCAICKEEVIVPSH